jgi:Pectate lyase superfamily protein
MAYQLFHIPKPLSISSNLTLQAGAKLYFFENATSTPQDTYQDAGLATPHANPVVADAAGKFAPIYLNPSLIYRVTLTDSADVVQSGYPKDNINDQLLSQAIIGAYLYPTTAAETAAGVTPTNKVYPAGNMLRYGANPSGAADIGAAFQAAIDQCVQPGGADVVFPPGTYLQTTQVTKDSFTSLRIFGYGATLDFRVDSPIKLGDHTVNGSSEFTQTAQTCSNIVIAGLKFKPGVNGWDGNRFAYMSPIDLSSVENAVVRDCRFEDWDFAAVNISAPSRHVLVEHCYFSASEEGDVTYGVRPFAHVAGASTDNYDETDGTLAYAAPSLYHQDIVVRDCYFYQCSHGILSWNVHGFSYVDNTFEKPTIRTISVTAWNFDGKISGNKHIFANNTTETVSTAIAVGTGSQRLLITGEHFFGAFSGSAPNDSLKVVDIAAVNEDIIVESCTFDVPNADNLVIIGPNVGATIRDNKFRRATSAGVAVIVINDQTASPVATPGFDQPQIVIDGNIVDVSTRFVELRGDPPGTPKPVIIEGNVLNTTLADSFLVTNTNTAGWLARARNNHFTAGTPTYCTDNGSGKTAWQEADRIAISGSTTFSAATTAAVTFLNGITLSSVSYRVVIGANANKTFWFTSRGTTGFTLNASSSSSDTVDWEVVSIG